MLKTFGALFEASSHAFHYPKFGWMVCEGVCRSYAGALRLTVPARCVCSKNSRQQSRAPKAPTAGTRREPSKNNETDPPRLAETTGPKIPVDAYRGGNAPRAMPALVEGGFLAPPTALGRCSPHQHAVAATKQQRGTENLKKKRATLNRPRPARASATPSPRGPPSRRPSRSRRSWAARRRPRRARRVVGPRPKVWFLRAFAAGAV